MRLNRTEILENLNIMEKRLKLRKNADKFAAYALLEMFIESLYTMTPMTQGELWILYKEAYGYCPKAILDIYTDFASTLPTDAVVSITKKQDELWIEVEDELISIMI